MTPALHFGIDVDEVCSDFTGAFAVKAAEVLGRDFSNCGWPEWDCAKSLGITKDEELKVWDAIKHSSDFNEQLSECPRQPGFTAFLNDIFENRVANVTFVTARSEHVRGVTPTQRQTARWLANHGFENPTVIVAHEKGEICKALGVNVFVDDNFRNCLAVRQACPTAAIYMPVYTYNEKHILDAIQNDIRPVNNAFEAIDMAMGALR
jgi:uncharacterized HAD superfamily protein